MREAEQKKHKIARQQHELCASHVQHTKVKNKTLISSIARAHTNVVYITFIISINPIERDRERE